MFDKQAAPSAQFAQRAVAPSQHLYFGQRTRRGYCRIENTPTQARRVRVSDLTPRRRYKFVARREPSVRFYSPETSIIFNRALFVALVGLRDACEPLLYLDATLMRCAIPR